MSSPIQVQRPGEYPRQFVPAEADMADRPTVEGLFAKLEERDLPDLASLGQWMTDRDEFLACLGEESARRHIEMTCATDDPDIESRHLHMVNEITPVVTAGKDRLSRKYLDCPHRGELDPDRHMVHDRGLETGARIFREENVELQRQETVLRQEHQKLTGAWTVQWRGEERTVMQMGIPMQSDDRAEREEAWKLVAMRKLEDRDAIESRYDDFIRLRNEIASNAGFDDYVGYIYPEKRRFDYGPAECEAFHEAVEACAVPFAHKLDARMRDGLGLETLRPWDKGIDHKGRPPLRPFEDPADLPRKCRGIFERVDPAFGETFGMMMDRGLLDLDSRKGKAPGGYQATLREVRLPFIFMNAAGTNRDVFTMLHEGGHAFNAVAARDQDLLDYRDPPMEFAEVASMGMELLCCDKLEPFYDEADRVRGLRKRLEDTVTFFTWCAPVDAFQHWVYRNPGHSVAERTDAWMGLMDRFGNDMDWGGHEDSLGTLWHSQLHIFLYPFYYIEYAIAQMGALQLWSNYRRDPARAVEQYRAALALGGSRPLPELFDTAGLKFDLSRNTLEPLVAEVEEFLSGLPE
ncbi:MAG: M3 family oligoendopeptidase [Planctomycetota bacterium]|jgi:oligoendopeptidase F